MDYFMGFVFVLFLSVCLFLYYLFKMQVVRALSAATLCLSVCVLFYYSLLTDTAKTRPLFVEATLETESVPRVWDALDDPAIWVNPEDKSKSLILGTDKWTVRV